MSGCLEALRRAKSGWGCEHPDGGSSSNNKGCLQGLYSPQQLVASSLYQYNRAHAPIALPPFPAATIPPAPGACSSQVCAPLPSPAHLHTHMPLLCLPVCTAPNPFPLACAPAVDEVKDLVSVHTAPPYHAFYNLVHHSRGLVPLLAGDQYYISKFTSTMITSLVTGG